MHEVECKLQFEPNVDKYLRERISKVPVFSCSGSIIEDQNLYENLLQALSIPPAFTTLRLNSSLCSKEEAKTHLKKHLDNENEIYRAPLFDIQEHSHIPDMLILAHTGPCQLKKEKLTVMVGIQCGMAVLRGAHVFAQGIMGAPPDMVRGSKVSVFADTEGTCRKGLLKPFEGAVVFVGNGVAELSRKELFAFESNPPSGIGIRMTDQLYTAPSLSGVLESLIFPQNLPSIVCSHVLNVTSNHIVLDMCAAPGGKTTHIAALMSDKGTVIALDKSEKKITKIKENARLLKLQSIKAFAFDATKSCSTQSDGGSGPPYLPATFDRIMLDAPCSALGQRPAIRNKFSLAEVQSYPRLQQKLFKNAYQLLKEGGELVYSTCTFTLEENEDMVAWALQSFPNLVLSKQHIHIGGHGLPGSQLLEENRLLVQRFLPMTDRSLSADNDTIAFFIAKFVKLKVS